MEQVKQEAVNQQTVTLPNGQEAPILVANLNEGIKMVIISENVLKYLTKLLPEANMWDICAVHITNVKAMNPPTMEKFTKLLRDELEFHESINLVKEYVAEQKTAEMPVEVSRPKVVS